MENEINENEIKKLTFISSIANRSEQWQKEIEEALENKSIIARVVIVFTTATGVYSVRTTLIAVIENYVRTSGDIVIPLRSITYIHWIETEPGNEKRNEKIYYILLIIFIILVIILTFFIPEIESYMHRKGTVMHFTPRQL